MNTLCEKRDKCRICGSVEIEDVINLGSTPPANAFVHKKDLDSEETFFPLAVNFCDKCFTVQLSHTVSDELLFKNYHYESSASRPLAEHFCNFAEEIVGSYLQSPDDLVVEIGSNDGCLLSHIKDQCRVLGVDPADNVAQIAIKSGVPTMVDFFTISTAKKIKSELGNAKVVVANNVMAHMDDIRGTFSAVKELLLQDGQFIFEVHWAGNLITKGGFDQIYHEHIFYHSLHALKFLIDSLGMVIRDVRLVPIHGESIRVYVTKSGESSKAVNDFLDHEIQMGLTEKDTYTSFANKIESNKKKLTELLQGLKKDGKTIFGYGAPAKGNTLLNYFQIGPDVLDLITDTTLAKQGTYTPGAHIPIVSPKILKNNKPDYILLLSWNYASAILEKEKDLRERGVKFIIVVPEIKIV
jgi:SAM-dependent methyltransferase